MSQVDWKKGEAINYNPPNGCIDALETYKSDDNTNPFAPGRLNGAGVWVGNLPKIIRRIYVGVAGTVVVRFWDGSTGTYICAAGQYIGPGIIKGILSSGTTASSMVGEV